MGWKERAQQLLGFGEKKEEKSSERTLHEAGVSVISDRKLENRIKLLMQLEDAVTEPITTDDLQEYLNQLRIKTDLLNHAIYEIAAPYARAGTLPLFARMLHGWSKLYASSKSWILRTEDVIAKNKKPTNKNNGETEEPKKADGNESPTSFDEGAVDKGMLVRFLHDVLQKHIWKDAFFILGQCFMDKDVSLTAATVIQSMQPLKGQGIDLNKETENM